MYIFLGLVGELETLCHLFKHCLHIHKYLITVLWLLLLLYSSSFSLVCIKKNSIVYVDLSLLLLCFVLFCFGGFFWWENISIRIFILSSRLLGDVFLIYCKNKGSQSLSADQLYNTNLHFIRNLPFLSELSHKDRVLSVFKKFHSHQSNTWKISLQNFNIWYVTFDHFMKINHAGSRQDEYTLQFFLLAHLGERL